MEGDLVRPSDEQVVDEAPLGVEAKMPRVGGGLVIYELEPPHMKDGRRGFLGSMLQLFRQDVRPQCIIPHLINSAADGFFIPLENQRYFAPIRV